MFLEWVLGVLFRPAATFQRAQQHLRFGYWWILLSVFTIEAVAGIYGPKPDGRDVDSGLLLLALAIELLILFDIQALFLMAAGRAFAWRVSWPDSLKIVGLLWSFDLVASIATFLPALKGQYHFILWAMFPFWLWSLIALAAGVKRLTGLPAWKAILLAAMASVPYQAIIVWLYWLPLYEHVHST